MLVEMLADLGEGLGQAPIERPGEGCVRVYISYVLRGEEHFNSSFSFNTHRFHSTATHEEESSGICKMRTCDEEHYKHYLYNDNLSHIFYSRGQLKVFIFLSVDIERPGERFGGQGSGGGARPSAD